MAGAALKPAGDKMERRCVCAGECNCAFLRGVVMATRFLVSARRLLREEEGLLVFVEEEAGEKISSMRSISCLMGVMRSALT